MTSRPLPRRLVPWLAALALSGCAADEIYVGRAGWGE